MTLVDTSVWIDHFRRGNADLEQLLEAGGVSTHPYVIGELSLGQLKRRGEILELLTSLPLLPAVTDDEALRLIDRHRLFGRGIGWVDVHLLAVSMMERLPLWTMDRRLAAIAHELIGRG